MFVCIKVIHLLQGFSNAIHWMVKVKFSHTRYRALGPELIPVYRQSARSILHDVNWHGWLLISQSCTAVEHCHWYTIHLRQLGFRYTLIQQMSNQHEYWNNNIITQQTTGWRLTVSVCSNEISFPDTSQLNCRPVEKTVNCRRIASMIRESKKSCDVTTINKEPI